MLPKINVTIAGKELLITQIQNDIVNELIELHNYYPIVTIEVKDEIVYLTLSNLIASLNYTIGLKGGIQPIHKRNNNDQTKM